MTRAENNCLKTKNIQKPEKPQWIDGKALAEQLKEKIQLEVEAYIQQTGRSPHLCVLLVGADPASEVYVRNKQKACQKVGIRSSVYRFSAEEDHLHEKLLSRIEFLNQDEDVDGILCQLPLPKTCVKEEIFLAIDPTKDVDGFHPLNRGLLSQGSKKGLIPCTPRGVLQMLESIDCKLEGKTACVVGRSNIVGRPMAQLLEQEGATVILCHSKTKDLARFTSQADILISAVGKKNLIGKEHCKKNAIVIDVAIHKDEKNDKLLGDVCAEEVFPKLSYLSPVPGGVGPMTIANLLFNTLQAARQKLASKK